MTERWDKIKGYLLDNPTLALSLLYLYVTAVGMLYSMVLYLHFEINVFEYSEITDFLLAAFKNPRALVIAAFTGAGVVIWVSAGEELWKLIGRLMGRPPKPEDRSKQERRDALVYVAILCVFVVSSMILAPRFADQKASYIKSGDSPTVEVQYRSFSGSAGQVTEPNLRLIGATQKAVFF